MSFSELGLPLSIGVITGSIFLLGALGLALLRIVKGPTAFDRIVALDLIGGICLCAIIFFAIYFDQQVLIDAAFAIALVSFIGTVALHAIWEEEINDLGRSQLDDCRCVFCLCGGARRDSFSRFLHAYACGDKTRCIWGDLTAHRGRITLRDASSIDLGPFDHRILLPDDADRGADAGRGRYRKKAALWEKTAHDQLAEDEEE